MSQITLPLPSHPTPTPAVAPGWEALLLAAYHAGERCDPLAVRLLLLEHRLPPLTGRQRRRAVRQIRELQARLEER